MEKKKFEVEGMEEVEKIECKIGEQRFREVIMEWIIEPEHTFKGMSHHSIYFVEFYGEDGELVEKIKFKELEEGEGVKKLGKPFKVTVFKRKLFVRNKEVDKDLEDKVVVLRVSDQVCKVFFNPCFPEGIEEKERYLPYFYPKVLNFSIEYDGLESEGNCLSLKARHIPGCNYKDKFGPIAKQVLSKLNKWFESPSCLLLSTLI